MLVSVIIPALNEAENIGKTMLAARRDYPPDAVEIIVVDGGSTDGTPDTVPPDVALLPAPRGRAVQMNRGAAVARGDILVFCHADSQLPAGWRKAVIEALHRPGVTGGTFQTRILPARGLFHLRNRWKFPANWRIMFGDQVQFTTRALFEQVGGFPELPLMEDVELSRALHDAGKLIRIDPALRVTTSSRRFQERGLLRQIIQNAINMFRYLYLSATAEDIARAYRSSRERDANGPSSKRQQHLIIYAKRPLPGYAKTRLGASIGPEQAAGVYARLLYDYLLDIRANLPDTRIELAVAAQADVAFFSDAFPEFVVRAQIAGDLGTRMRASFDRAFAKGADVAILTGSDIVGLDATAIHDAFAALETAPAVIGPATDGGYYLLGMRAPGADLFRDIAWSTGAVLAQTEALAREHGLTIARLPALVDMDTVAEYETWRAGVLPA